MILDKQSIDEKMIITSFHGPKSTNISIDRLKKKVSAPGATSTDYVSRNKDLSSVAMKKQKEDEQKSPKKNKKYENVTPRYMNTISNGETKQNAQQAIETDKDGVFGQGKKGTNRDSLNPPQWVDSTKRENTMREDSFLDMQQLQARVIENMKPFVENEKSGRSKSPIVNGTLNDQRALKTSQVAINSHRNSQAEVKLNKRPSVSPSFAKNQTKPTQAAEEQVTRKLTKPVQANAQTKISNKEKDQSKKENQEPPKIKPSLMESQTSGRINEPKKSEPLEVLPSSNNRPISPVQNNKSNKKQDNKYKPETIDLCMKLEEYTKYKENLNSMNNDKSAGAPSRQNQPQTYSQTRLQKMNKNNDNNMNQIQPEETENKENSNPEQFLMKKINNFKDNSSKKRRPSTSADKKRVSQPKYIKKAIEFEQYSYQPMLSKKSLQLAEKKVVSLNFTGIYQRPVIQI